VTAIRRTAPLALLCALTFGATVAPQTAAPASASAACTIARKLRLGSQHEDVKCLEQRLIEARYTLRHPDRMYGTTTDAGVPDYQRANRLSADGIVGAATGGALGLRIPLVGAIPAQGSVPPKVIETRVIGTSVEGRDIVAHRMGTPGGRVVLIIGSIHGDEVKGTEVAKLLRTMPTPKGIDLWLVDTMNPDGVAAFTRGNANHVDLNRNFELGWSYIPKSTQHRQYSGEAPADQPETRAVQRFLFDIEPALVLWFHQDANVITVNGARRELPTAYGRLVGLGTGNVPCSQMCTGTASTFANSVPGATSFLVELPGSSKVTAAMLRTHAGAILTISVM
jgi:protein MpaA